MLKSLHLRDVGPAPKFDVELGERMNIFTGDNSLGKTFLLDVAWWALTRTWVGEQALPRRERGKPGRPTVKWEIAVDGGTGDSSTVASNDAAYNFETQR